MWHIQSESYKVKSKLGIVGVFIIFKAACLCVK